LNHYSRNFNLTLNEQIKPAVQLFESNSYSN